MGSMAIMIMATAGDMILRLGCMLRLELELNNNTKVDFSLSFSLPASTPTEDTSLRTRCLHNDIKSHPAIANPRLVTKLVLKSMHPGARTIQMRTKTRATWRIMPLPRCACGESMAACFGVVVLIGAYARSQPKTRTRRRGGERMIWREGGQGREEEEDGSERESSRF